MNSHSTAARGDACGCAMGAWFLGAGLAGAAVWYGWHWHGYALSMWGFCWHVLLVSFAAAVVGKGAGILAYTVRRRRAGSRE
jgi:hypothetical protein